MNTHSVLLNLWHLDPLCSVQRGCCRGSPGHAALPAHLQRLSLLRCAPALRHAAQAGCRWRCCACSSRGLSCRRGQAQASQEGQGCRRAGHQVRTTEPFPRVCIRCCRCLPVCACCVSTPAFQPLLCLQVPACHPPAAGPPASSAAAAGRHGVHCAPAWADAAPAAARLCHQPDGGGPEAAAGEGGPPAGGRLQGPPSPGGPAAGWGWACCQRAWSARSLGSAAADVPTGLSPAARAPGFHARGASSLLLQWGTILEELCAHVVPHLEGGPRAPRDFPASEDARTCIQMFTAAVLQMIQVGLPGGGTPPRGPPGCAVPLGRCLHVEHRSSSSLPPQAHHGLQSTVSATMPQLGHAVACRRAWTSLLWTASPPAWPTATRAPPPAPTTFGRCALTGGRRELTSEVYHQYISLLACGGCRC